MSSCPTTSPRVFGRYFSTQISFIAPPTRRIRRRRNKALAGGSRNLRKGEVQEVQDRADRVDERRRLAAREQEPDAPVPFVDDEGPAVAASRQDVAHDLLAED